MIQTAILGAVLALGGLVQWGTPDQDQDGAVGIGDLLLLVSRWGECPQGSCCPGDIDRDCIVGLDDLLIVLDYWGNYDPATYPWSPA